MNGEQTEKISLGRSGSTSGIESPFLIPGLLGCVKITTWECRSKSRISTPCDFDPLRFAVYQLAVSFYRDVSISLFREYHVVGVERRKEINPRINWARHSGIENRCDG